jgi:hypothetical protein
MKVIPETRRVHYTFDIYVVDYIEEEHLRPNHIPESFSTLMCSMCRKCPNVMYFNWNKIANDNYIM